MSECTATVPDRDASGDNFYGANCAQIYIDYFWNTYGFADAGDTWHHGFGYEDPCNSDLPLARTFNACYALTYSAEDWANDSYDAPQNTLQWGRRFVRDNIDDLRAHCGDGSADADSESGPFVDDHVDLYLGFFYGESVVERASTFMHEARHQSGKDHDAKFPKGSIYGEGKDGADSSFEYQGAWAYEVSYLAWFAFAGARTTSAMRELARQIGNRDIDNAFANRPNFSL
jgi:hypothetical protein